MAAPQVSQQPARSAKLYQEIKATVAKLIDMPHFKGNLGSVNDIVNIVMALMDRESSINPSPRVAPVGDRFSSSGVRDFVMSDVVKKIEQSGDAYQRKNLNDGICPMGLMQVMGWNIVKGASARNKKCEVERVAPEFVGRLCVNAGDDIRAKIYGPENIENNILVGLIILKSKYDASHQSGTSAWVGGRSSKQIFNSKIGAAIGAYLGLGDKDKYGTTPAQYVADILGGKNYIKANGPDATASTSTAVAKTSTDAAAGPTTSGAATGAGAAIPGCTA